MPSVLSATVPPAFVVIVCAPVAGSPLAVLASSAIVITSPSGSISLLITLLLKGTSAVTLKESSVAMGGVLSISAGSGGSIGPFKSRTSIDTVAKSVLPKVSIMV